LSPSHSHLAAVIVIIVYFRLVEAVSPSTTSQITNANHVPPAVKPAQTPLIVPTAPLAIIFLPIYALAVYITALAA